MITPRPAALSGVVLFLSLLVLGTLVYGDYGMSIDSSKQKYHGLVTAKYLTEIFYPQISSQEIFTQLANLEDYEYRYYGTLFQLPFVFLEVFTDTSSHQSLLFRHLATFLLFFISLLFFYRVSLDRFSGWIPILGVLVILTTPRIFAESFYNIKDINALSLYLISACAGLRFVEKRSYASALLFSLACAIAINIRINTAILPLIVVIIYSYGFIKLRSKRDIPVLGSFLCMCTIFTVLFYPASWANPINFFLDALVFFGKYKVWDGTVIYFGNLVPGQHLPWHYLPVWIAITIPPIYSICMAFGMALGFTRVFRAKSWLTSDVNFQRDTYFLILWVVPLLVIITIGSTLYGGWRHLYFVYPPMVWSIMVFFQALAELKPSIYLPKSLFKKQSLSPLLFPIATILLTLEIAITALWMVRNHPYQYMYFNPFVRPYVEKNFDRDYWRISSRQALQHLMDVEENKTVKIAGSFSSAVLGFLSNEDLKRFQYSGRSEADYFIEFYRNKMGDTNTGKEVYSIKVDDIKIATIIKLE